MGRLFSFDDLVESETQTAEETRSWLAGSVRQWPEFLDLLIKLGYYFGDQPPIETPDGIFQSHACLNYLQVPYSFRAAYLLWECGYYAETVIIIRHLLEVLVQLRYLKRHPEKTQAHMGWRIMDEKKNRVTIRTMFDEISPGLYDGAYSNLMSEVAHGGAGRYGFHVDVSDTQHPQAIMGNRYDEYTVTMALNYLQALLFGYLNLYETFFPRNTLDPAMTLRLKCAKAWLRTCMLQHRQVNPKSCDWYAQIDKIIFPDRRAESAEEAAER